MHVRRVPHTGVADRAQRILHGKSTHLPKDGEMIENSETTTRRNDVTARYPNSQSAPETFLPELTREHRTRERRVFISATQDTTVCTVLISQCYHVRT